MKKNPGKQETQGDIGKDQAGVENEIERERYEVLSQLEDWLELPVMLLGFAWLVLLVIDLIWGLNPFLNIVVYIIWGIFLLDFLLRFILAPHKLDYLRKNWLTALSLAVPALRIGRIAQMARLLRLARAARGLRLFRLVTSLNRGMRALRATMRRRGAGYIGLLTLAVTFVGAAGMYAFEGPQAGGGSEGNPCAQGDCLETYGEALWWTSMIMTTLGSEYWPKTAEGRMLALLLSLFAFGVFGYVTATLASFFIGQEAEAAQGEATLAERAQGVSELDRLREEMFMLREEIQLLRQENQRNKGA